MKMQIWSRNGNGIITGNFTPHNISPYGSLWEVTFDDEDSGYLAISEKCIGANVSFNELTEKQIRDTISYYQIGQGFFEMPEIVGTAEVAEILGWDRRKVSVYYGRGLLPKPIQKLRSGPLWKRSDIEHYKEESL